MHRHDVMKRLWPIVAAALALSGCAALQNVTYLVQPPRFERAAERPSEVRLVGPSPGMPTGGANVRLWTQVTNPNPFGFTLSTLRVTLSLEGARAADGDFPVGLPLEARESSVIPIDLHVSFADIPGLSEAIRRAVRGQPVAYHLDGTIGVQAGRLGTPTFGPMRLFSGELGR